MTSFEEAAGSPDLQFMCCSALKGHARRGMPSQMLSIVEFQPQCDKKPPVAGCCKICFCGTQPETHNPRAFVRSLNPGPHQSTIENSLLENSILEPPCWNRLDAPSSIILQLQVWFDCAKPKFLKCMSNFLQ